MKAPDGSAVVTNSYVGRTTITTDASGTPAAGSSQGKTIGLVDAFGRLKEVTEDPAGPLAFITVYKYDGLDNLTTVCPVGFNTSGVCTGTRLRTFTYDSLKRLLTANNPESGLTTYTYDANGNLATKTDARNWKTTFAAYDVLNRPTSKSYSNPSPPASTVTAPSVTWTWDTATNGKGQLASIASGTTTVAFSGYDSIGRVLASTQTTSGTPYTFGYTYNLAGGLEKETYPSARAVTTCYDQVGRADFFHLPEG